MNTATIKIHICDQRRAYLATFSTQDQAVAYLTPRTSTHSWDAVTVPADWSNLLDFLYPTCEHGMSASSCYGPEHFMSAAQEQAMNWSYSDAPSGF